MIKVQKWICPHGYEHRVTTVETPTTGSGERRQPGYIDVSAPQACPWCTVKRRVST